MYITLKIDTTERNISLDEDITFAVLLARLKPQYYQPINNSLYPIPFLLLIDNEQLISAYDISAIRLKNKNIITFPFAYTHTVFQYIAKILFTYGIQLNNENISLCVFTLYVWYVKKIQNPLERAIILAKLYPHLFKQPYGFLESFNTIVSDNFIKVPENMSDFPPSIK